MEVQTATIGDHLVAWRAAPSEGTPVLWLHGVPDSGVIWEPFLAAAGGVAPDLPGFGASGKRADFPYSIEGYADFLEAFCAHLSLGRVRLVMHDWGAVGLAFAQRHPERIERLVAIDVVPFVEGYRWHRVARLWRTKGVGELAMGVSEPLLRRALAAEHAEAVLRHWDHGTQRAILRLYRSAPPDVLAAAGRQLGEIGAPALVAWGERDPYIAPRFGQALASALGDATFESVSGVGHWGWLESADLRDRIVRFATA